MKNLFFTFSIISLLSFSISCSSDRDETSTTIVTGDKTVKIPDELLGTWKINIVTFANDPNYYDGNGFGAYIKFNPDNTIEYKDGNKFGGVNDIKTVKEIKQISGKLDNSISLHIDNIPKSITCTSAYSAKPGQVQFRISYDNIPGFYDMLLIGTKQ